MSIDDMDMSTSALPTATSALPTPSHIIGIGASAGGLNALEQFFDNMPDDTGMAFVIIQHLSPDFRSLMDDLLARHTSMPIHRVTNGLALQPNSVYLIPPKTHMTIKQERLYLTERTTSPGLELPIDIFLNSLAADAGERAVGVILSGTGSDGSRGVVAIHRFGGLVMVQAPESAQFDGMPRNAIATSACDFILAPDRMPRLLVEYTVNPHAVRARITEELAAGEDEGEFAGIFALLRRSYNLDFSKYKGATVGRRIRRRMEFRQIPEISDYMAIVAGDPVELDLLYKDLLIGVTEFFRDTEAFLFLEQEVIPGLFSRLRKEDLRVWSAACATGEEAYSLAILLAEQANRIDYGGKITVFATDVHRASLDFASQGLYDRARLTNVKPEWLERYFKKEGADLFRVTAELRKLVVFAPHNLINDPPFTRLDLVCCRNFLIYLQPEAQERIISLFHFALKKDGLLFLGKSEGLATLSNEFETVASQHKLFRKVRDLKLALNIDTNRPEVIQPSLPLTSFPSAASRTVSIDRQLLADYDKLLGAHMPAGILIDESRHILHYFGSVADYLKPPEGRAQTNLLALVEGNLAIALNTSLQRADKSGEKVITNNVRVRHGSEEQLVDLTVTPLSDDKSLTTHYLVSFERVRTVDHPHPPEESDSATFIADGHYRQYVADLEVELQSARENLQTTVEELQTSNEELQAANEELLAANEELQSTNEELHSVNEELYSVNAEFERKNIELKQLNIDHENLLVSIDTGIVFLDRELRIRKFNPAITTFFKLLPQDIGRPIDHIAYHLAGQEEMLANVRRVLATGVPFEKEEQTRDGRWLLPRIMPFRNETGQMEGVVITFSDITIMKEAERKILTVNDELERNVRERTRNLNDEIEVRRRAEQALREQEQFMRSTIDGLSAHICVIDTTGTILITNRAWNSFATVNGMSPAAVSEGASYFDTFIPRDAGTPEENLELAAFREGITGVIAGTVPEFVREYPCDSEQEERWFICRVNRFLVGDGCFAVISHENITDRKKSELQLARNNERLECLVRVAQNTSTDSREMLRASLEEAVTITKSAIGYLYCYGEGDAVWTVDEGRLPHLSEGDRQLLTDNTFMAELVRQERPLLINNFPEAHPQEVFGVAGDVPLKRLLSLPLCDGERIVAVVAVADKKSDYDQTDLLQLTLLMESVWRLTSRIRDAEELRKAKDAAEIANRAKSEFLANMSHEIRTPMNAVLGLTQLLAKEPLTADQQTMVGQIRASGSSLLTLINDILDFSKIEAGELRIEPHPFSLTAVLEQVHALVANSVRDKGLSLRLDASPGNLDGLIGDDLRLGQILLNLTGNAIKFTEQGEIRLRVQPVAVTATTARLRFDVSDTGIGIAPESQPSLFEPFRQADGSITRRFGGTGLGLSICRSLVELMGGSIGVESSFGSGSTFWFEIPFERTAAVVATPAPAGKEPAATGPRLAGRRFLVVDDSEINQELVARALAREGAEAMLADDGRQGLDSLRSCPGGFDAVLMDIQMPVMDGLTASTAIRRELGLTDLPVIAFTAGVLPEERQKALDAGVFDFLPKPVDLEEMVAVLQRWTAPRHIVLPPLQTHPHPGPLPEGEGINEGFLPLQGGGQVGDGVVIEHSPALPAIPGIDMSRVADTYENDREFFLEMLTMFCTRFGETAEQIRDDLARGDRHAAARQLHTLRGSAGNLGALELMKSAGELEQAIVAGRPDAESLLEQLAAHLALLTDAAAPLLREWTRVSAVSAA